MLLNNIQAIPSYIAGESGAESNNKTYVQTFSGSITANNTSNTIIHEFPEITIQGNRNILLSISVPSRSDDDSWGGLYITTNLKVNGTWHNLGNCGYAGNVMVNNSRAIGTHVNSKLLDLRVAGIVNANAYTIAVELVGRAYSGVTTINSNMEINDNNPDRGNSATVLGSIPPQNFTKVIIQELDR
jgi:hypothetical protein